MFWKDNLAKEILDCEDLTTEFVQALTSKFTQLQVKTVDAQGKVPVIKLSGAGTWHKPTEWAVNHVKALQRSLRELHQRLDFLGDDLAREALPLELPSAEIVSDVVEDLPNIVFSARESLVVQSLIVQGIAHWDDNRGVDEYLTKPLTFAEAKKAYNKFSEFLCDIIVQDPEWLEGRSQQ